MPEMTLHERMALTMQIYNSLFASKANGIDIVTVQIFHRCIVNGAPILNHAQQRVGGAVNGKWFKNGVTGEATLRGFDIDLQVSDNRIIQLRFIEQNPDKVDDHGKLKPMAIAARRGSKIMWLIDRKVKAPANGFLARVQDGRFIPTQDRAIVPASKGAAPAYVPAARPAAPAKSAAVASHAVNDEVADDVPWAEDNIPEIPDIDIPEEIVKFYAEQEDDGDEAEFSEF